MMIKLLLAHANPVNIKAALYAGTLICWAASLAGLDTTPFFFALAQMAVQTPG